MKNDLIIAFVILVLTAAVWGIVHYDHPFEKKEEIIKTKNNYPYIRWGH